MYIGLGTLLLIVLIVLLVVYVFFRAVTYLRPLTFAAQAAASVAPGGVEPPRADSKSAALPLSYGALMSVRGVADGTRTRDHRDHNPGLYQLSYRHRAACTG